MDFEYAIIGGGPAGYTAGMLLAQAGKSVVIFEKDKLGGTCLNRGCIPTKSLLHSSEIYAKSKQLLNFGISLQEDNFDFSKVIEKKDITVEKIRKSLELAVKNSGAKVVYAEAKIISKNLIKAADEEYNVGKIILASGAKPRELKGLEFDGTIIYNPLAENYTDNLLNQHLKYHNMHSLIHFRPFLQ